MLGDMAADISKVEQPNVGDNSRAWGPPFVGVESIYFLRINRNKRSITLDLRHPDCAEIMRAVVAQSDIVIENFVPGLMRKYGFDYDLARQSSQILSTFRFRGLAKTGPTTGEPPTTKSPKGGVAS